MLNRNPLELRPWRSVHPAAVKMGLFGALVLAGVWLSASPPPIQHPPSGPEPLRPVPVPLLDTLEPSVAEQIRVTNTAMERALQDSATPRVELAELFGAMAELYQAYELYPSSEPAYRNALDLAGDRFRWVYLLGRAIQEQGRLEEALQWLEKALVLSPGEVPCLVHQGNAYLRLSRYAEAERSFTKALEIDPACGAAHFGLGDLALKQQNFDAAIQSLNRALEIVPGANRVHYLLAMAYRGLGQVDRGKEHLGQSGPVGIRVNDPLQNELQSLLKGERIYLLRGGLAYKAGRYQDAITEYRLALDHNPEGCAAHINLGVSLATLAQRPAALVEFRQALQFCKNNASVHFNLAQLLAAENAFDQAEEHFLTGLSIDPNDVAAHLELGRFLAARHRTEEAAVHLREAISLDPASEEARFQLAAALAAGTRFAQAVQVLEEAQKAMPRAGRILHLLARILAACPESSLRDGVRAVALAESVYHSAPSLQHAETLAMAWAEVDRCGDAAALTREALRVLRAEDPDSPGIPGLEADLRRYEKGAPCRVPAEGLRIPDSER